MKAKTVLPVKEALLDAMSVAETSVEAAEYLATQFKEVLTKAKMLDKYADILQKVEDFAQYTKFKLLSNSQPWAGQTFSSTDFNNMQANIAIDAAKNLENMHIGTENNVVFDFAINNQSEFLRGYSTEGKALNNKSVESMDKLFSAWLAENNLISKDSSLYKSDKNGKIVSEEGQNIKANAEEVKALISDPEKGFEKYLSSKGIQVTTQQQQYPSAQQQLEAEKALKDAIQATAPSTEEAPTQPGMSAG